MNGLEMDGGFCFPIPKILPRSAPRNWGPSRKSARNLQNATSKSLAVSVDPLDSHRGWINDINETQNCTVAYPIIADPERNVANLYDMIHPNALDNMTVRSVFVIGPDKKIKLTLTYPASTGRNFDEILRVVDSLQLTANHQVATPANWKAGEDCIIVPAVKDEDIPSKFPKGHRAVKPYLRYTPQPNQ